MTSVQTQLHARLTPFASTLTDPIHVLAKLGTAEMALSVKVSLFSTYLYTGTMLGRLFVMVLMFAPFDPLKTAV